MPSEHFDDWVLFLRGFSGTAWSRRNQMKGQHSSNRNSPILKRNQTEGQRGSAGEPCCLHSGVSLYFVIKFPLPAYLFPQAKDPEGTAAPERNGTYPLEQWAGPGRRVPPQLTPRQMMDRSDSRRPPAFSHIFLIYTQTFIWHFGDHLGDTGPSVFRVEMSSVLFQHRSFLCLWILSAAGSQSCFMWDPWDPSYGFIRNSPVPDRKQTGSLHSSIRNSLNCPEGQRCGQRYRQKQKTPKPRAYTDPKSSPESLDTRREAQNPRRKLPLKTPGS